VIGTLQATEALKYILGLGGLLTGALLTWNALTSEFRKVELGANKACRVCGENADIKAPFDYESAVCAVE
jgi:molybdopterin/thiamine biosynthesis adenylyltransferase